ncbi:MBL fold metallo-hydrolase [Acuticoccus sediminis]|uniref:MBL fold metallo-hydrolase n=1 Tax=Acuticoccus sediminis TaxID=2184697 RepID=A0A8B2NU65_9HYPH|nr:MBL fold metallo-hydrolase [Acuticoccus sediminis]RAI00825.1 MBL fold metallo-hydrolase [Acuticoccus sediminis]
MKTFKVGSASVTRIEEVLEVGFAPSFLLPGFEEEVLSRDTILTSPNFLDAETGRVRSSIHSWLIRLDGLTILVDTCSGNGKARALPLFQRFHMLDFPYLDNLAAAGVAPEDVDIVFCTHLHIDHVGWNTRAEGDRWVPTFPNAKYVFGKAELAHWTTGEGPRVFPENVAVIEDSVLPVLEAGRVDLVEPGDEIAPGLTVEAAPGHTITQLILRYDDGAGNGFVCSADCLHQPIQVYAPELSSCFCEAPERAVETRHRLLAHCADTGALLLPMHFGPPHAGYVVRSGDGYAFKPVDPR